MSTWTLRMHRWTRHEYERLVEQDFLSSGDRVELLDGWLLVQEPHHASLRLDRTRKARIYARAGIADYWVVNLVTGVLEVYRDPIALDAARRN